MARINGTAGGDNITGTAAADTIYGYGWADVINGADGNDTIRGGLGNDFITGEFGNDTIRGGLGNDFITGEFGNDTIYGDGGNDFLVDQLGTNRIFGGDGSDRMQGNGFLSGGAGIDLLIADGVMGVALADRAPVPTELNGGSGADTFNYISTIYAEQHVTIDDFKAAQGDKLWISSWNGGTGPKVNAPPCVPRLRQQPRRPTPRRWLGPVSQHQWPWCSDHQLRFW